MLHRVVVLIPPMAIASLFLCVSRGGGIADLVSGADIYGEGGGGNSFVFIPEVSRVRLPA